jgi:CheY-like chemotaxis protein
VGRWREALGDLVGGERVAEIGGEASPLGEQVRLAEMIESATAAASGLHQIKEIAQGLSHLARVEHEPCSRVDLNVAAEAALKMVSQEIALRAISVVDLSPVPAIVASGSAVAQVLLNLLLNAAHSIEKGTRDENRVTLRTWAADGYVFAEVTDTGCGIPPEDQAAIFEPFFTTRGPKRGTGLGLAVSHRIVSDCGGDIEVRSDVGAGSRFLVRFPVAPTETAVPDPVVADGLEVRGRILLVDDDPFVRRAVTKMLARHHDIVAARSGREAMELLATDADFGLVLCDLMMVDVAGIDVHAWLALHHPALARRVVFITGGVFTPGTGGYLDAHPEIVCLQKPFDMKGLRRLVQERLVALSRA